MRRRGNSLIGYMAWAVVGLCVSVSDTRAIAADRVQPVPLGGKLADQKGEKDYGVYVPTRFGGVLTIKTTSGKVSKIVGPDGKERTNGAEVGNDQQGWFTFRIVADKDTDKAKDKEKETDKAKDKDKEKDSVKEKDLDKAYTIETTFVQVGESLRRPWNFYYWPTKSDAIHEPWAGGNGRVDTMRAYGDDVMVATPGGYIAPGQDIVRAGLNGILETPVSPGDDSTWFPNLYDDLTWKGADGTVYSTPSPLLKYDQLFGTSARNWEAANSQNQDISRWPGHCLGGAVASILLNEPRPAPGSGMTSDELKALWSELGENHYNHRIGDYANEIPAGPPRPGLDACDRFVPRFHAMIETHIRGRKIALLGNLRAFPPRGTPNEVWNHGIGKYTATFHAIPGKGERSVRIETEMEANSGSNLNNDDNKPRVVKYEYTLVYGLDGKVDETNVVNTDWISVGGEAQYAPLNILEVLGTTWQGHNPMVNQANVTAVDLANGGGGRFMTSTPPVFRPVGDYEAGRGPMLTRGANVDASGASPRRGLFRFLGR